MSTAPASVDGEAGAVVYFPWQPAQEKEGTAVDINALNGPKMTEGQIQTYLARLGIREEWLDRFPSELSGGELQRFCVARALASGADFLICDEISTMLDPITQSQIWNFLLAEVKERKIGLLVVSHDEKLMCHRLQKPEKFVAKNGVLKFSGSSSPSSRPTARATSE